MRLTLLNQFYPPDVAPTGRLAASVAEHRAAQGDLVTVVTGTGRYVQNPGSIPGPAAKGPNIHRLWTPGLGKGSLARRLIDYLWFYLAAALRLLTLPPQDLVIALTTPPFIAWAGVVHAWLHPGSRLLLWNMDCYPEAPIRAGLIREHGWVARLLRWQNRLLLRRQDRVVCLDGAMEALLQANYGDLRCPLGISVISNWEPSGRFRAEDITAEWTVPGVPAGRLPPYVLHVGNAGYGHDFETTAQAARMLESDPMAFVFIGGGVRWSSIEAVGVNGGLQHWHLVPYLPEDELVVAMAGARCALITLRDSYLGVISPSKLHGALALGLPVLYIGPEGSNVDECVKRFGCGASLRHGDVQGAVGFLRRLGADDDFCNDLRRRARDAFEAAYSERQGLSALDAVIRELGG